MGSTTSAGTGLAISAALPATEDAAGYAALTFVEIGGPEQLGAFGASNEVITFQPLKGPAEKHKGGTNYGAIQPSIAHDDEDAGQTLLRTAAEDQTDLYAFEITFPSGAKRYFCGRVFGYPENVGAANSIIMANPSIEISTKVVKVDAP
jgi:hypothetical protein